MKDFDRKIIKERLRAFLRESCSRMYLPCNSYRLQLNREFTFKDALHVLPYLQSLGIDTIYTSPFLKSAPGSPHGYDVTDPALIDTDLGGKGAFLEFSNELRRRGMGLIADVVPNHMGIQGSHNAWWMDVLENGPTSDYARTFDIEWMRDPQNGIPKVVLPILGDTFGRVLERQELKLGFDANQGRFFIDYWENHLPVAPATYGMILGERLNEKDAKKRVQRSALSAAYRSRIQKRLGEFNGKAGDPKSFDAMQKLLDWQFYHLTYWRVASEKINYRRFFDINSLAAIRNEDEETFLRYHESIFRWVDEGRIQGLRIDHTDGLYDPKAYLEKIQSTALRRHARRRYEPSAGQWGREEDMMLDEVLREKEFETAQSLYVVIEKILERKESLSWSWKTQGTVGYAFMSLLDGLFVQSENEKAMTGIYAEFAGQVPDYAELVYQKKKFFALVHMSAEINALAHRLEALAQKNRHFRDFTLIHLTLAIRETIACFPVYRTYMSAAQERPAHWDKKYVHIAIEKAKVRTPAVTTEIYDYLKGALLNDFDVHVTPIEREGYQEFTARFQQITGPVMAKGVEDTVYYAYHRLISLNEVGGDPLRFGASVAEFHRQMADRLNRWSGAFMTGMTHDTKRSEDVRLRLNALSEIPDEWKHNVLRWKIYNREFKTLIHERLMPEENTEYFIYQTLVGLWPDHPLSARERKPWCERAWNIIQKGIREAKSYTNWTNPNTAYENAVQDFVETILLSPRARVFYKSLIVFQKRIAWAGRVNSLSAAVVRAMAPGVVDTYQGSEVWDDRFVDPDNRGKVDYRRLKQLMEIADNRSSAFRHWSAFLNEIEKPYFKLGWNKRLFAFRKRHKELILNGDYIPLEVRGRRAKHVIAYARKHEGVAVIAAASRFLTTLSDGVLPIRIPYAWPITHVVLSPKLRANRWKSILTGQTLHVENKDGWRVLRSGHVFSDVPANILVAVPEEE